MRPDASRPGDAVAKSFVFSLTFGSRRDYPQARVACLAGKFPLLVINAPVDGSDVRCGGVDHDVPFPLRLIRSWLCDCQTNSCQDRFPAPILPQTDALREMQTLH